MNKEFISYEQALELKELGFDEPCLGFYDGKGSTQLYFNNKRDASGDFIPFVKSERLTWFGTPTFSQSFRWFREKHGLRNSITDFIDDETGIEWDYEIAIIGTDLDERGNYKPLVDYSTDDETRKFKTYEEAELACLQKLIEIVKNQNNG